mgnify:CR=1 FL=1
MAKALRPVHCGIEVIDPDPCKNTMSVAEVVIPPMPVILEAKPESM